MDVTTAIEARRAAKSFDPNHVIDNAEVTRLLDLARMSPTAFNIQHWRFVIVRDRALREAIRDVTWMQPQVTDASLLIIVCADVKAWEKRPDRYWRLAPAEVREGVLEAIATYYQGREQLQRDEAMRSCGIAAQTLMLAAKAMGYDSCPMDLSDMDAVGRLIRLPADHVIGMFVAVGKAVREPWGRPGSLSAEEVILTDRF